MRVEACLGAEFAGACVDLLTQVRIDFEPDLVIGIARGGVEMVHELDRRGVLEASYVEVVAARPSTPAKTPLSAIVRIFPQSVRDRLRVVEHHVRQSRSRSGSRSIRHVVIPRGTRTAMARATRILVIDDAVDTGETLKAVTAQVRALTSAEIRTAVIAVTFARPLVEPDYALRRNVLLRFPWSMDTDRRP